MSEPIEVFTEDGLPSGRVKPRDLVHRDGDWHLAAFVWVFDRAGRLLLQRRSPDKDVWPGLWDASAAGHVTAAERASLAAVRELEEELGVEVPESALIPLAPRRQAHAHPNGLVDREHHAAFVVSLDLPLEAYRPGPEVTAIGLVGADELVSLARGEIERARLTRREVREVEPRVSSLGIGELVPYDRGFFEAVVAEARGRR